MTLDELLAEIERAPRDARLLRALGGALGIELSKRRLDKLTAALRALAHTARDATTPRVPGSYDSAADAASYAAGYAAAATDVTSAFQAVLAAEADEQDMAALARNAPYGDVLLALAAGAQTPTAIADRLGKNKSSASRALSALRDAGLVAAFAAPDGNERVRPHQLTPRGERVVAELRGTRRARTRTPARGLKIASAMTRIAPSASRKLKY
jgi:DNA-binding MarR family transcriptional regulator